LVFYAVLLILGLASYTRAETFYVSPAGSDENSGTDPGSPFLTLQHATSEARPGDEVLVADGNYRGTNITRSGTPGAPITFRATGPAVVIDRPNTFTNNDGINVEGGDWIVIEGFLCRGLPRAGIRLVNADHCTVRNNLCEDNGVWGIFTGFTNDLLVENNICSGSGDEHGIYVSNSSDRPVLHSNTCFSNRGSGIQINADANFEGDGISSDAQIYNNTLYDNGRGGGAAINLDGAVDALIYNNLLYGNHATGIALFKIDAAAASSGARIYHNTIINASDGRWCIVAKNGSTEADIRNNILFNNHQSRGVIEIDQESLNGLTSDYNIIKNRFSHRDQFIDLDEWIARTGQDRNSITITSLDGVIVDEGAADYHLTTNSVAVDAALPLPLSELGSDHDGSDRPQGNGPDAGAFEMPSTPAYDAWIAQFFTGAQLEDPGITGKLSDPDADGIPNLGEYGFGTDPSTGSTGTVSAVVIGGAIEITFPLSSSAVDLRCSIQTSGNLSTWSEAAAYSPTTSGLTRSGGGGTQVSLVEEETRYLITERLSSPGSVRQFTRIQFVQNQ